MLRYGAMSQPLTAHRGVALWIASLAATPANPSVLPDNGRANMTPDTCGPISSASSEKSGPGSAFLKTWLDTFNLVLNRYGETCQIWVTRLRRDSLRRQKLAPHINDSGSSSWPTPTRADDGHKVTVNSLQAGLIGATSNWATPTVGMVLGGQNPTTGGQEGLGYQTRQWPTPDVPNGGRTMAPEDIANKGATAKGKRQVGLENVARLWPTPRTSDTNGPGMHGTGGMDLRTTASYWATPTVRDHKDGANPSEKEPTNSLLGLQAPRTPMPGPQSSNRIRGLNPRFVEWLMGFPIGWTDLQPLETQSFQQWQQQHGDNLERRLTGSR